MTKTQNNSPISILNHYKMMYAAGKFTKDSPAHKRMHQLFDEICLTKKAVKQAKLEMKKYENHGDTYVPNRTSYPNRLG